MNHTPKNSRSKEDLIIEFCLIIKSLFPGEIVAVETNEKYHFLISQLDKKAQKLVQLLTHHLTQLYQNHRVQRAEKVIEIADEDVLTALKIIENLDLNTQEKNSYLSKINRNHYLKIVEKFSDTLFNSKELQDFLNLSKTQSNNLLNLFLNQNLVQRYGHQNKNFYYQIIEIRTKPLVEIEEESNDIFDGFNDFNDTQNIDYEYRKDNFGHKF
jgi:hypothetical protein